ncbi:hypothetical protein EAO71_35270 [Streptomyces sp. ms191]|nr:hypothetical protein EAO71_35270 [Streptomyces sp. ms191]
MSRCALCEAEFAPAPRGRPSRFCSDRCRKARHQRERTLRAQVERYNRLARLNPEPYSSMWASMAADAQADLSKLS